MVRPRSFVIAVVVSCAACSSESPSGPSGPATGGSEAVTSLQILGNSQLELIGATNALSVLAFRANGTTSTAMTGASWLSSNPAAVTVSPMGVATAVGVGASLVSGTYEGFSASLQMRVGAPIDCTSYFPTDLSVLSGGGIFTVALPFGTSFQLLASFATESDAAAGLAVFQRYRNYCFVGRNNARTPRLSYIFGFWLNQFGLQTTINNEDCEAYDKTTVQVVSRDSSGWAVVASGRDLALLDTAADATTMAEMIKTVLESVLHRPGQYSAESGQLHTPVLEIASSHVRACVPRARSGRANQVSGRSTRRRESLAGTVINTVRRLRTVYPDLQYNLVIQTSPAEGEDNRSFSWHMRILPRHTKVAGYELATGMWINSVRPEDAAATLRQARLAG